MFDTEKETSTNSPAENESTEVHQNGTSSSVIPEGEPKQVETIDYKDLFLRLNADFQNFKKRIEKQKSEWLIIGEEAVIVKLLPVIQDLERALGVNFTGSVEQAETWVNGLKVVHKNLIKALADLEIKEIDCSGAFNPELHEAISQIESPVNKSSGQIVDVVSRGYLFKGKVIKYAQVTVAK